MDNRICHKSLFALLLTLCLGHGTVATAAEQTPAKTPESGGASKPKEPPKPLPDLSIDLLELVPLPIDRRRTRIRVRVSNAGVVTSPPTGVLVQCFVTIKEAVHNCRGSNPPPRFSVPHLRPGESRTYEVPLGRFLEGGKQSLDYDIKALVDTSMRSAELDRYNNSRQLRVRL
jgi:hypothetical protein